jgi:hypothetical protein
LPNNDDLLGNRKEKRLKNNSSISKERGIRISEPPLGRPPAYVSREQKKQALDSEKIRNEIEGKFGQAKRRFSLERVMAKLPNTSLACNCYYFFSHESFHRSPAVFLCVFVSISENNTCFWLIDYQKLSSGL